MQGETTLAERFSAGVASTYHCNLELVGQFEGEGAGFAMQVLDHCAYYATWSNPRLQRPGVVVLDIADAQRPRAVAYLDSPAARDPGESLAVALTLKVLLVSERSTAPKVPLEIYALSPDCSHPILKSRGNSLPPLVLHTGQFTADGRTFYGAKGSPDPQTPVSGVFALDTSDPSNPRLLTTWTPAKAEWLTHAVSVGLGGNRAYVAFLRYQDDTEKSSLVNGLAIFDISDIQMRRPHPQFRLISTEFWDDTHYAQFPMRVLIARQPYVIFTDLNGAIGTTRPLPAGACASAKPGWGFARLIDITDELHPRTVSKLMLEVDNPDNCANVIHDPTAGYGSLACDVDDRDDAKLLACGYFEAGLRVFDIRDPRQPREVAYYKPPARRGQDRPGSILRLGGGSDLTADQVVIPKFLKDGQEIAFISFDNGFQVVRFTEHFITSHPDLFTNTQSPRSGR